MQGIENIAAPDFQADRIYNLHEFAQIAAHRFNLGSRTLKNFIKANNLPGVTRHQSEQREFIFCNHETAEWLRAACRDQVSRGMPLRFVSLPSSAIKEKKGKRHHGPK